MVFLANFFVFDIRHDNLFSTPEPMKVIFDYMPVVAAPTKLKGFAIF